MYSSSFTTSRIVDDLIPFILEGNDHWWPRDLIRLSQVSQAWLGPARRILYASPALHSFNACSQLARTLSDNPSLCSLVKEIDLRPISRNSSVSTQPGIKEGAGVRFILGLEGLESVTLGGYLAFGAERFLHSLGDPYIVRYLHIDGSLAEDSLSARPSLEWDESLAFKFQSLRILRLTSLELDIIYPSIPYQLSICEFILDNVTITSGFLSHLLCETPSLERLCMLTKDASEYDEHLKLVLGICNIQILEYETQTDLPFHHTIFNGDTHLPSLRCLRLNGVHIDTDSLHAIGQSCRNLEELSIFGRTVNIHPQDWVDFLKSGNPSSLHNLGLPWGTNRPPFMKWHNTARQEILAAAAHRRIHVFSDS
ncbi:hypothetical protein BDZ94DRAFT_1176304 [Collybia nuda]|uniref:F-box protein n=1 Tax=Collybia nuda TaxID=64659 RepID=A0A9P5XT44_9AGAR|nr:hypothetical protein BDZ94DRAFT_1176304 [Collybia nuda]